MKRRDFIKFSGAGVAAGLGLLYGSANAKENPPGIKKYGRLGRTGLKMSDLGLGLIDWKLLGPDELTV